VVIHGPLGSVVAVAVSSYDRVRLRPHPVVRVASESTSVRLKKAGRSVMTRKLDKSIRNVKVGGHCDSSLPSRAGTPRVVALLGRT